MKSTKLYNYETVFLYICIQKIAVSLKTRYHLITTQLNNKTKSIATRTQNKYDVAFDLIIDKTSSFKEELVSFSLIPHRASST